MSEREENQRRRRAAALLEAAQAMMTAYEQIVAREFAKTRAIFVELQPWLEGGPLPRMATRYLELEVLADGGPFANSADSERVVRYGSNHFLLLEETVAAVLKQAAERDPEPLTDAVEGLWHGVEEMTDYTETRNEMWQAMADVCRAHRTLLAFAAEPRS